MMITQLPEDIFPINKNTSDPFVVHAYTAPAGAFRGKSMLNWNAISLVISGEKILHFAEKSVTIKEDEFHILSSGNCIASMNLSGRKTFSSILVFFNTTALEDFCLKYDEKIKQAAQGCSISPQAYLTFEKDTFILNYINSLHVLLRMDSVLSKEMKRLKFEELMLYLLSRDPVKLLGFLADRPQKTIDLVIRKAAEGAIRNPINLDDLAFICSMSVSTFKRNFSKLYGMPPNQWFIQKRMELAKHYLVHHHIKPSEVYHLIGYGNHASFSKKFKEVVGITPSEFQARHLHLERNATAFE